MRTLSKFSYSATLVLVLVLVAGVLLYTLIGSGKPIFPDE